MRTRSLRSLAIWPAVLAVFASSLFLAPTANADPVQQPPRSFTVTFRSAGDAAAAASALSAWDGRAGLSVLGAPTGQALVVRGGEGSVLAGLRSFRGVTSVEPTQYLSTLGVPDDPELSRQATMRQQIDLDRAWAVSHGSPAVRVAVIDTGVDGGHPDLTGQIVGRFNAVTGASSATDTDGHGTAVASVIAAKGDNAIGIAGVAWRSKILAVRTSDSHGYISDAAVANGIDWAVAHGARVVNVSLGAPEFSSALQAAVGRAIKADVVVVAAAGDHGTVMKLYPAAFSGVIAVGATHVDSNRLDASAYGSWVDLFAPGAARVADRKTHGYVTKTGTSYSAAEVSGVAALVAARNPSLSASQVRQALVSTGTPETDYDGYEFKLVNAYRALGYHLSAVAPTIVSPQPGSSVGDHADLTLTVPGYVDGDTFEVTVDGGPSTTYTSANATLGPTTHLDVDLWGLAGSREIRVVHCSQTLCPSVSATVDVAVDYSAPTITAPLDGDHVTDDVTASVTGSAPMYRFVANGGLIGESFPPGSATLALIALPKGAVTLSAVACDATGARCALSDEASPVGLDVARLDPQLTLSRSQISPNGDGVADAATVTYSLDSDAHAVLHLYAHVNPPVHTGGTTIDLGDQTAGVHSYELSPTTLSSGPYELVLDATGQVAGEDLRGEASADLTLLYHPAPVHLKSKAASSIFPEKDGYLDSVTFGASTTRPGMWSFVITSPKGSRVFSATRAAQGASTVGIPWSGRTSAGHVLPAGTYAFVFIFTDLAGNVSTHLSGHTVVDRRKLTSVSWHRTVEPGQYDVWGAYYTAHGDQCSKVSFAFPPTQALQYHACAHRSLLALHYVRIPGTAVRVKVDTVGQGEHGSSASLYYWVPGKSTEDLNYFVRYQRLSKSRGTHLGRWFDAAGATAGQSYFHWMIEVDNGATYDIRHFRITAVLHVLR